MFWCYFIIIIIHIPLEEQDEQLEESLRDSHRLIVTLTTFREILKKEHIARLSVIHANAPRIQSLVDDAARQLLNLKTELQDQESKLAKIVTRELLQFNDINEKSEELAIREKQLVARKAALEAELLRVNEELNTVRAELKSCATQRNAAFKEKEEEEAKEKVARTKEQMQAQKVFTEALSSCHGMVLVINCGRGFPFDSLEQSQHTMQSSRLHSNMRRRLYNDDSMNPLPSACKR